LLILPLFYRTFYYDQYYISDGAVRQYETGVTALDVPNPFRKGLREKYWPPEVEGQVWDATRQIKEDGHLKLLTWDDTAGKNTFWHSSAHLMAEAIEALFPV
jgi:threonyl-tRNA synthetase